MARSRALTYGFVVSLMLAAALPASAGEVIFSIKDGRVTLVARNAPIADILAVWEKEGRTKIVARERVQGVVTSLEITNQPESEALAIVLRNVTGYIAAKWDVAPSDASIYRCIVISPAPAPAFVAQAAPPQGRTIFPPPQPMGYPPPSMGVDGGMNPPGFIPPADDGDDNGGGGTTRIVAPGLRLPSMTSPGATITRPPGYDPNGAAPPPAVRPGQPSLTPVVPGAGTGMPGAVVPTPPKPPGTPGQIIIKPPGVPDEK